VLEDFASGRVDLVAFDDGLVSRQKEDVEAHGVGTLKISC
jgi:hypothetical protein